MGAKLLAGNCNLGCDAAYRPHGGIVNTFLSGDVVRMGNCPLAVQLETVFVNDGSYGWVSAL